MINNLKKYNFSDSLIIREKQSYQVCIDSLEKVRYSDFKTKYIDLGDYERTNCDFGNYYRWIGGQEPIDGVKVSKVQFKNTVNALLTVDKTHYNSEENKYLYWGNIKVALIKVQGMWKINDIKWN